VSDAAAHPDERRSAADQRGKSSCDRASEERVAQKGPEVFQREIARRSAGHDPPASQPPSSMSKRMMNGR
jgi:hypothetical protein